MPQPLDDKRNKWQFIQPRATTVFLGMSFLFVFLVTFKLSSFAATEDWVNSTRTNILALASARTTAVKELENLTLSAKETSDYQDFVVFLNTRILTYCRELAKESSLTAIADLPCPMVAQLPAGQGGAAAKQGEAKERVNYPPVGMGSSQTQAEKTGELNDQFLNALGNFDEMLLKEDAKVASRVPRQRETGNAGTAGSGMGSGASGSAGAEGTGESSGDGVQGSDADEGSAATGTSGTQTGKAGGDGAPGAGGTGKRTGQTRAGVPDGQLPPPEDDDIVARQLREAAEKETDPELKKKLWEEYWKYKGVAPKGG